MGSNSFKSKLFKFKRSLSHKKRLKSINIKGVSYIVKGYKGRPIIFNHSFAVLDWSKSVIISVDKIFYKKYYRRGNNYYFKPLDDRKETK